MTTRTIIVLSAALFAISTIAIPASGQVYDNPEVKVSKEIIRSGGKLYYWHIVEEKQTLYSIGKTYGVSLQEIYDSNKLLNLETEGLKNGQALLIPVKEGRNGEEAQTAKTSEPAPTAPEGEMASYFFHRVKWYEDLESVAKKYKVSEKSIMNLNGMTSSTVTKKQMIKIPNHPEAWENATAAVEIASQTPSIETENAETSVAESDDKPILEDIFHFGNKHNVDICIALPFNATKNGDSQMFDFYSGALLASRDLGKTGMNITLNVFDVAGGSMTVPAENFESCDFTIGPVSNADISKAVRASEGRTWIVSPFDQKVLPLADTVRSIIQAPTPVSAQIADMVNWISTEMRPTDNLVVISQKGVAASGYANSVIKALQDAGMSYKSLTFNVLEGRDIMNTMISTMNAKGSNRVVIASDNKPFVMEAMRNISMIASSGKSDIQLYGTARLRSFEGADGIDVAQFHSANAHISGGYYIDYGSKEVRDFVYAYRALFKTEPSQSAFQGYDLMTFFSTLSYKYGKKWENRAAGTELKGLQSDLRLRKLERGGYVNNAVRRVVYEPDYNVKLIKGVL